VISIALIGVQFAWSIELITVSPYFDGLGLSPFINHFVWAVGPISGFLVGPTVGIFSDNCRSKFGRRRPFIFGGLCCTTVMMAIFSNSKDIGIWLGDPENFPDNSDDSKPKMAIIIALLSFLFLDLSINTVQGPLRALISDLVTCEQQNLGQAMATLMQAFGSVLGNLACYLLINPDGSFVERMRWIYMAGYALLIVTVSVTLLAAQEIPFCQPQDAPLITCKRCSKHAEGNEKSVFRAILSMDVVVHIPPYSLFLHGHCCLWGLSPARVPRL